MCWPLLQASGPVGGQNWENAPWTRQPPHIPPTILAAQLSTNFNRRWRTERSGQKCRTRTLNDCKVFNDDDVSTNRRVFARGLLIRGTTGRISGREFSGADVSVLTTNYDRHLQMATGSRPANESVDVNDCSSYCRRRVAPQAFSHLNLSFLVYRITRFLTGCLLCNVT